MYLFTRSGRLRPGQTLESMAWAVRLTEKVNQISEVPVTLWTPFASAAANTLTWVAMFEDLSVLEATDAKLIADPGFVALADESAAYAESGLDDSLWQVVYADPAGGDAPPQYINLVSGALALGHFARGVELGVELAQRAAQITGCPTSFAIAETGPFGAVEFAAGADSVEQLHAGKQALNGNQEFAQLLDGEASTVFQPGATQAIFRKIA